jgi:hypothetical protein
MRKHKQRLEVDRRAHAAALVQRDRGALRAPRARDVGDVLLDADERHRRRVLDARDLRGVFIGGHDHAVPVPHLAVLVREDARMRAAVVPLQRRPQEEDLGHARGRRARRGRADGPHAP